MLRGDAMLHMVLHTSCNAAMRAAMHWCATPADETVLSMTSALMHIASVYAQRLTIVL